jgi:hypothetical protein
MTIPIPLETKPKLISTAPVFLLPDVEMVPWGNVRVKGDTHRMGNMFILLTRRLDQ